LSDGIVSHDGYCHGNTYNRLWAKAIQKARHGAGLMMSVFAVKPRLLKPVLQNRGQT